jgi:thiamine-phosphate pyrophosphorylase
MAALSDTDRSVVLRIIDANANRCAEGLRVVEEIARFSSRNAAVTSRLKELRHEVRRAVREIAAGALEHRDVPGDVGRSGATASELARGSLAGVARANFARAEEALRVLEEFGKLLDEKGARAFKSLRFALYAIETSFVGDAVSFRGMPPPPFLYAIVDRSIVPAGEAGRVAAALVSGGADVVQYRAKGLGEEERRRDVSRVLEAAQGSRVPVIVNDDAELARETGADGVHVGAGDISPGEARALLGPGRIVGLTVGSLEELERAELDAVDYVAVAAVFPSPTKREAAPVGLDLVRRVRSRTTKTLVAIGGITPESARSVIDAGADGVAAISAILAGDPGKNCFTFKKIIGTPLRDGKG